MKEKVCLITGANSGIGKAAAEGIAQQGATVVVVCRSAEKGQSTVAEIVKKTGNTSVDFLVADLSSQADIRKVAEAFGQKYSALHVLVNNAGIHLRERTLSVDGIEMTFAVNHLAYFLLTNLLLDTIKASAPARIVNVSSAAHHRARVDFDDLQGTKEYSGFPAYCLSKLCNLLFTYELARRLEGTGVTVNALHPGVVATRIFRDTWPFVKILTRIFGLTSEKGAETSIYLATSPEVEGVTGKYFINRAEARSSSTSHDVATAQRLWDVSSKMTSL